MNETSSLLFTNIMGILPTTSHGHEKTRNLTTTHVKYLHFLFIRHILKALLKRNISELLTRRRGQVLFHLVIAFLINTSRVGSPPSTPTKLGLLKISRRPSTGLLSLCSTGCRLAHAREIKNPGYPSPPPLALDMTATHLEESWRRCHQAPKICQQR